MTDSEDFEDGTDFNAIFNTTFKAIRIHKNHLTPVTWKLKAHIVDLISESDLPEEEKDYHLSLSLAKIRYWFKHCIEGALIFSYDNEWAYNSFFKDGKQVVKNKIVITPKEPTDEVLSWLLQSKMNSLSNEGEYLNFPCIELTADDSEGLEFYYIGEGMLRLPEMQEWVGDLSYFDEPWWMRDDASTIDVKPSSEEDLTKVPAFAYSLDFLGDAFKPVDLGKDKIVRMDFRPRVIDCGEDAKNIGENKR